MRLLPPALITCASMTDPPSSRPTQSTAMSIASASALFIKQVSLNLGPVAKNAIGASTVSPSWIEQDALDRGGEARLGEHFNKVIDEDTAVQSANLLDFFLPRCREPPIMRVQAGIWAIERAL